MFFGLRPAKGIGAFLQEVDGEFAHLTDFLVKRHLLQQSLNLLFYFLVSWMAGATVVCAVAGY